MRKIIIMLDSTCDMSPEMLEKYDVEYIPMGVSIGDKEYPATLEWKDFKPSEYYKIMESGTRVFTIQVTEQQFTERFTKILDEGNDVIYISCSSGLSGSIHMAEIARKKVLEGRTEGKIICIDSLISGLGQAMMGIRASELRAEGKDIEEIGKIIEDEKMYYNQWGTVGNLTYLAKAGRVKASKAFFGNLFGVKPIIISSVKGANVAYKKVKGRKAAIEELAQSVADTIADSENRIVGITNADCPEEAEQLKQLIIAKGVKCKEIVISSLGPILGASCGPKTLIAYNYGKKKDYLGDE